MMLEECHLSYKIIPGLYFNDDFFKKIMKFLSEHFLHGMRWCHYKDIHIFGMDYDKPILKKVLYLATSVL